jgi:hypothetical protein
MNIDNNKFKYIMIFLGVIFVAVIIMVTTKEDDGKKSSISNGLDIPVMPTKDGGVTSDSEDDSTSLQGIILNVDDSQKTILLNHLDTQTRVTYSYTGGTDIVNRYDEVIAASQLKIGEVVEVEFAMNKKLSRIKICDTEWEYTGVTNFQMDTENKILTVGSEKYVYTDNMIVINEDNISSIDKLESIDVVTLKGRDKQLDSIIVTSGHGYVRLDSTAYFEGGFIEIGSKVVQVITENMVIPVPAGDYNLRVTKGETSGEKEISVEVNEEIRVNLTEFQSEAVRLGTLSFKITPSNAKLMIDGVSKDYSGLVDVAYGLHKITISADGYDTYTQTIDVEDIFKEYDITLSEASETSAAETETEIPSSTEVTTSSTKATTQATTYQTIDYSSIIDALFG